MDINIVGIVLTIIFAGLAWYVNGELNVVPMLNKIVKVLIVVISILCILYYCGLGGNLHTHIHVN